MSVERGIGSLTLFGDQLFNIHSVIGRLISSMRRYVSLHNDYNGFWVQGPSRVPRTYEDSLLGIWCASETPNTPRDKSRIYVFVKIV